MTYRAELCLGHGVNNVSGSSSLSIQILLILYTKLGGYKTPTAVDSLITIKCGSNTPGNEMTPMIPAHIPMHSISSTEDKSHPETIKVYDKWVTMKTKTKNKKKSKTKQSHLAKYNSKFTRFQDEFGSFSIPPKTLFLADENVIFFCLEYFHYRSE